MGALISRNLTGICWLITLTSLLAVVKFDEQARRFYFRSTFMNVRLEDVTVASPDQDLLNESTKIFQLSIFSHP